ncbi:hypothetical protein ACWDTQ_28275 [Streptomyces cellulosae]
MSKPNPVSLAVDLVSAATTLFTYFEALKAAGFTEGQALILVRESLRGASTGA